MERTPSEEAAFEYISELDNHRWIQERISDPDQRSWHTLYHVIPDGFPAYVRIFHRASRDRILDTALSWQQLEADSEHGIYHHDLNIEDEPVHWADVAKVFDTIMHPKAQWHRILGQSEPHSNTMALDADGWRYNEPREGSLDLTQLTALAKVLMEHTTRPENTVFAIWEGWGGLTSSAGFATFRFYGGIRGRINSWRHKLMPHYRRPVFRFRRTSKPGTGVLSEEASSGPRLELPNRNYILFRGDLATFVDRRWIQTAPWLREHEHRDPQTPSLIWSAEREWVVATEIDFDSTLVGGSRALIDAILADPELEAAEIGMNTDLTYDGDTVNGSH